MKKLPLILSKALAVVLLGVVLSPMVAFAFTNLNTSGSGTGGGSGSTPSLSQVTAIGASTADQVSLSGGLIIADGSVSSPSLGFISDTDTGLHRISANQIGVAAGGSNIMSVNATSVLAYQPIYSPAVNSSTQPNVAIGKANTGYYSPIAGTVALMVDGALSTWWATDYERKTKGVIPSSNETIDNGIVGNGWRNVITQNVSSTNATSTVGYFSTLKAQAVSSSSIVAGSIDGRGPGEYLEIRNQANGAVRIDADTGIYIGGPLTNSVGIEIGDNMFPATDNARTNGTNLLSWQSMATYLLRGPSGQDLNILADKLMYLEGDQGVTIDGGGFSGVTVTSSQVLPTANDTIKLGSASLLYNALFVKNVTTTGQIYAANLTALGATGDLVCQNNTTNELQVQAVNCTVSSIRFKEHVQSLDSKELMEKSRALRSVMFDYRNGDQGTLGTTKDEGFIAEEVAMIDPYLVVWVEGTDAQIKEAKKFYPALNLIKKNGKTFIPKTVDYMKVSVILTGAIQNLDDRLILLESKIN